MSLNNYVLMYVRTYVRNMFITHVHTNVRTYVRTLKYYMYVCLPLGLLQCEVELKSSILKINLPGVFILDFVSISVIFAVPEPGIVKLILSPKLNPT